MFNLGIAYGAQVGLKLRLGSTVIKNLNLHQCAGFDNKDRTITSDDLRVKSIDFEVSRLAIVCPCLLRIMILCYSPRPKSG